MVDQPVTLTMLPVIQKWDCHVCGSCCKEYEVRLSEKEAKRVSELSKNMGPELGYLQPLRYSGWLTRVAFLNHTSDGACVFLGQGGRCKLHEKHGYDSKPLPCRLFPWVLVPRGDKWTVGIRFACPSAAENKGRPIPAHTPELEEFASELVVREGLNRGADGTWAKAPSLDGKMKSTWDHFEVVRQILLDGIEESLTLEQGIFRAVHWISSMKAGTGMDKLDIKQFGDLAKILWNQTVLEAEKEYAGAPEKADSLSLLLFRQCAAIHTRKDHGPKQGIARRGPLARFLAIIRFSVGKGPVPRLHGWVPEADFAKAEEQGINWSAGCEEILRRYYLVKINSGQFAGSVHYRMSVWDGFASLVLTFPIICWITRLAEAGRQSDALIRAISIVDDHFGFNRVLGGMTQRVFLAILLNSGRLGKLVRWYGPGRG